MRDFLATELITKITGWKVQRLTYERQNLKLLAEYKYDEYQQFSPGMRFIESLALWLYQFQNTKREIAYEFIKNNLIFISTSELNHLIRVAYPDFIKPYLIKQVAYELGIDDYLVKKITNNRKFEILRRRCLFLGLSDGAHVDIFRRFSGIDHEQIYSTYSITKEKSEELRSRLHTYTNKNDQKYKFVFLIDDFSASGISYIRKENGEFKGKIYQFYKQLESKNGNNYVKDIFTTDKLKICIVLYIATTKAKEHIKIEASKLLSKIGIETDVIVIQELDDRLSLNEENSNDFIDLMKEKYDKSILTKHYKKGKHDKPYLGFNECGLSVVLSHNCPNNSLPIIWHQNESKKIRALFPRIERH